MKCDKSQKRNLITRWGIRQLASGRKFEDVKADMSKHMRQTLAQIKDLVSQ